MESVLVICRDRDAVRAIQSAFSSECRVDGISDPSRARGMLRKAAYEFVGIDIDLLQAVLPDRSIEDAVAAFQKGFDPFEMIVLSSKGHALTKTEAEAAGAVLFLTKPFSPNQLLTEAQKILGTD